MRLKTHSCIYPQTCLPGLHISLGIFYRLFSLLEQACYRLDVKASESVNHQPSSKPSSYQEYCRCQTEMVQLKEEKRRLEEEATILEQAATYMSLQDTSHSEEDTTLLQRMQHESTERRTRISSIVSAKDN